VAGATIGKLAVILTAESSEFAKTLDNAEKRLTTFASKASSTLAGALSGPKGLFGALTMLPGGGTVGAAVGAVRPLLSMLQQTGREMAAVQLESKRFGLSPNTMQALNIASRGNEEALSHSLRHMNQFIGEAAAGGTDQSATLARLGLTPEQLEASADPFEVIIDKLNKLPTATQRAMEASKIFGKNWLEISDMISRGSKDIDNARRMIQEKGLGIDADAVNSTKAYAQAVRELELSIKGLKNNLAGGIGTTVNNLMAQVIKNLTPTKSLTGADILFGRKGDPFSLRGVAEWFGLVGEDSLSPKQMETQLRAQKQGEDLDQQRKSRERQRLDAQAKMASDIKSQSAVVAELNRQVGFQADVFGQSEAAIRTHTEALKLAGPAAKDLAGAWALLQKNNPAAAKGLREYGALLEKMADAKDAAALVKATGDPLDKFQAQAADIFRLRNGLQGLLPIGPGGALGKVDAGGVMRNAMLQNALGLINATGVNKPLPLPPALIRGTAEERSYNLQADRESESQNQDIVEQLKMAVARQTEIRQAVDRMADRLADAMNAGELNQVLFGP
jgi:hypothetical protein